VRLASALLAVIALGACAPERFAGTDISKAAYASDFNLHDHRGAARSMADYRGRIVALTFGYVSCPDVCPTTLAAAAEAVRSLGRQGGRVQVLFVTVDPERDTAELLGHYVPAFHPSFVGLRGDAAATAKVAKDFRIFYQKHPNGTVDHTAGVFVFDADGRLRLFHGATQTSAELAHDLTLLLGKG
jgi:protein SCO1/2